MQSKYQYACKWDLAGVVDRCLCESCTCAAIISASVLSFSAALSSHWQPFNISHFFYLPMIHAMQRSILPHVFTNMRSVVSVFLMYLWMFVVSSWIAVHSGIYILIILRYVIRRLSCVAGSIQPWRC